MYYDQDNLEVNWLNVNHTPGGWNNELGCTSQKTRGKGCMVKLLKMALAETVYYIWIIRNKIIFQDINKEELRSQGIIDMVLVRVELDRKLAMFCNRI